MAFDELLKNYAAQVLGTDVLSSLTKDTPTYLEDGPSLGSIAPLAIAPIASPFMRRKRRSGFPMPSDFKRYRSIPQDQRGIIGEYEDGGDETESIELEDLPVDLSSYLTNTPTGKVDIFGNTVQLGPKVTKGIFGVNFATSPGKALGEVTSMVGPLGAMAGTFGQQNLKQLEYITAMAGLGKKGYGVGLVNGQVVGVTPNHIVGTLPTKLTQSQRNQITDKFTGKSGAVGAGVTAMQQSFSDSFTPSAETKAYENAIMKSTLSTDMKSQMLGFNPSFRGGRFSYEQTIPTNYKQSVSGKQYIEDMLSTEKFRDDMDTTPSFNFGLETDIVEQDKIQTAIETGGSLSPTTETPVSSSEGAVGSSGNLGGPSGGPVGGTGGLNASQPPSYDDNNDSDGGSSGSSGSSGGDSGFGGGGWTAYGGRIKKAYGGGENKGFTSKTPKKITIQGVGLIKPNETFLKTDTVTDRYNLEARENDFIINGPTSEQFREPILAFINQAETNLKNKGVDIRVGKPTIPVSKQVPLLVASSETYIPKEYIEAFNPNNPEEGYDILEAMNNVGRPEVTRLKSQLDNSTDQNKYQANKGMRVGDPRQGFLSGTPKLNLTSPNIDKSQDAFVPGISDEPIAMNLDQQKYFGDYEFGDIKKAIKRTEIKGFEEYPYIFTGVKAKKGKASSAFGPMQITAKTLQDFKDRSSEYGILDKNEKKYIEALLAQGEDKINKELYGTLKRGPKESRQNINPKKIYGKKETGLKPYGRGVVASELHKKYYDKIADRVLMHKLGDHKTIEKALASYGEGANYSQKVLNDLLDIMQGAEPPTKVISK